MNARLIEGLLRNKYPTRTIIKLPEDEPEEIICEIEPTQNHPEWSKAVAVIDSSRPHRHPASAEDYRVTKGEVVLNVDGREHRMKEGEEYRIEPGVVHSATGNEAWVEVTSYPGWTPEDHVLVE